MKINQHEDTLHLSGVGQLDSAHAAMVYEVVVEAMTGGVRYIEVDLSDTVSLDSCGLGTLVRSGNWLRPAPEGFVCSIPHRPRGSFWS